MGLSRETIAYQQALAARREIQHNLIRKKLSTPAEMPFRNLLAASQKVVNQQRAWIDATGQEYLQALPVENCISPDELDNQYASGLRLALKQTYRLTPRDQRKQLSSQEAVEGLVSVYTHDFFGAYSTSLGMGFSKQQALRMAPIVAAYHTPDIFDVLSQMDISPDRLKHIYAAIVAGSLDPEKYLQNLLRPRDSIIEYLSEKYKTEPEITDGIITKAATSYSGNPEGFIDRYLERIKTFPQEFQFDGFVEYSFKPDKFTASTYSLAALNFSDPRVGFAKVNEWMQRIITEHKEFRVIPPDVIARAIMQHGEYVGVLKILATYNLDHPPSISRRIMVEILDFLSAQKALHSYRSKTLQEAVLHQGEFSSLEGGQFTYIFSQVLIRLQHDGFLEQAEGVGNQRRGSKSMEYQLTAKRIEKAIKRRLLLRFISAIERGQAEDFFDNVSFELDTLGEFSSAQAGDVLRKMQETMCDTEVPKRDKMLQTNELFRWLREVTEEEGGQSKLAQRITDAIARWYLDDAYRIVANLGSLNGNMGDLEGQVGTILFDSMRYFDPTRKYANFFNYLYKAFANRLTDITRSFSSRDEALTDMHTNTIPMQENDYARVEGDVIRKNLFAELHALQRKNILTPVDMDALCLLYGLYEDGARYSYNEILAIFQAKYPDRFTDQSEENTIRSVLHAARTKITKAMKKDPKLFERMRELLVAVAS